MNVDDASTRPSARRRDLWLLALGSAVLFLVVLGARDLWNPNEPIYGRAVVEMWESGQWLLPTVNGGVFAEKPILYYWLALAAGLGFAAKGPVAWVIPGIAFFGYVAWHRVLPVAIAAATLLLYLTASVTVLPAANAVKSARGWAELAARLVRPEDKLVSYGFRRWPARAKGRRRRIA